MKESFEKQENIPVSTEEDFSAEPTEKNNIELSPKLEKVKIIEGELTLTQKDIQRELISSLEKGDVKIDDIFDKREVSNDSKLISEVFATPEVKEASKKVIIQKIERGDIFLEYEHNHIFKKYVPRELFSDKEVEKAVTVKVGEYIKKGDRYRAEKLERLVEELSLSE